MVALRAISNRIKKRKGNNSLGLERGKANSKQKDAKRGLVDTLVNLSMKYKGLKKSASINLYQNKQVKPEMRLANTDELMSLLLKKLRALYVKLSY